MFFSLCMGRQELTPLRQEVSPGFVDQVALAHQEWLLRLTRSTEHERSGGCISHLNMKKPTLVSADTQADLLYLKKFSGSLSGNAGLRCELKGVNNEYYPCFRWKSFMDVVSA